MAEHHLTGETGSAENFLGLIELAKQGDSGAFEVLYKEHYAPIFRFVFFRVKRKEDAEDISQTVFVRALESIARYEQTEKPFIAWLYTIARNLVLDHFKKKRDTLVDDPALFFDNQSDDSLRADRETISSERASMITRAIASLPDDQQEVIILKCIEERSYEEIALITGKNEEALRALKYRGLKNLKDQLNENE